MKLNGKSQIIESKKKPSRRKYIIAVVIIFLCILAGLIYRAVTWTPMGRVRVIVMLHGPADNARYEAFEKRWQFKAKFKYQIFSGFAAELTKEQINALEHHKDVKSIELDRPVEYLLDSATYWSGADEVQQNPAFGGGLGVDGTGVTIMILDSGIDPNHVDFPEGKILAFGNFTIDPPGTETWGDPTGHGTVVASIAAGEGIGNPAYKGVAPGASLVVAGMGVEAMYSNTAFAIDWVITDWNPSQTDPAKRIRVMNMSFGTTDPNHEGISALELAIDAAVNAGIVVVAATTNHGPEAGTMAIVPGGVESAITVGGIHDAGEEGIVLAWYSGRGPTQDGRIKPDIVAPSAWMTVAKPGTVDEYVWLRGGTSSAAPFVSGTVALMLQENPALTPAEVKAILEKTAIDFGLPGKDNEYGSGVLDVFAAVDAADGVMDATSSLHMPGHVHHSGTLSESGAKDQWPFTVNNISCHIGITLIMPDWVDAQEADFNLELYDPNGTKVASSETGTRQENIGFIPTITGEYRVDVVSKSGSGAYYFDVSAGFDKDSPADVNDVSVSDIVAPSTTLPPGI